MNLYKLKDQPGLTGQFTALLASVGKYSQTQNGQESFCEFDTGGMYKDVVFMGPGLTAAMVGQQVTFNAVSQQGKKVNPKTGQLFNEIHGQLVQGNNVYTQPQGAPVPPPAQPIPAPTPAPMPIQNAPQASPKDLQIIRQCAFKSMHDSFKSEFHKAIAVGDVIQFTNCVKTLNTVAQWMETGNCHQQLTPNQPDPIQHQGTPEQTMQQLPLLL